MITSDHDERGGWFSVPRCRRVLGHCALARAHVDFAFQHTVFESLLAEAASPRKSYTTWKTLLYDGKFLRVFEHEAEVELGEMPLISRALFLQRVSVQYSMSDRSEWEFGMDLCLKGCGWLHFVSLNALSKHRRTFLVQLRRDPLISGSIAWSYSTVFVYHGREREP